MNPITATPPAPSAIPERRRLIAILAGIEGVLMLGPLFFTTSLGVQPVSDVGCGSSGAPSSGSTTAAINGPACGGDPNSLALAVLTTLAVLLAIMLLPVLIGLLSRRWQTAVAAPTIPLWILTVAVAALTILNRLSGLDSISFGGPFAGYNVVFSLLFATPLVAMILLVGAIGGLAWLVRRGFAR